MNQVLKRFYPVVGFVLIMLSFSASVFSASVEPDETDYNVAFGMEADFSYSPQGLSDHFVSHVIDGVFKKVRWVRESSLPDSLKKHLLAKLTKILEGLPQSSAMADVLAPPTCNPGPSASMNSSYAQSVTLIFGTPGGVTSDMLPGFDWASPFAPLMLSSDDYAAFASSGCLPEVSQFFPAFPAPPALEAQNHYSPSGLIATQTRLLSGMTIKTNTYGPSGFIQSASQSCDYSTPGLNIEYSFNYDTANRISSIAQDFPVGCGGLAGQSETIVVSFAYHHIDAPYQPSLITQLVNNDPNNEDSFQILVDYDIENSLIVGKYFSISNSGALFNFLFYADGVLNEILTDTALRVDYSYDSDFWTGYVVGAERAGLILKILPVDVAGQTKIRRIEFTEMLSSVVQFIY